MNHSLLKRTIASALFGTASLFAAQCLAKDLCADHVVIKEVYGGWVNAEKGADNGNAVMITYMTQSGARKKLMLSEYQNLNDRAGPSLLSMLMLAQTTGQQVTLNDHNGTRCDDFDEIVLHGY